MKSAIVKNMSTQPRADERTVRSKVLVIEHDKEILGALKYFCDDCKLDGYQASENILKRVLICNIDLGAIFLPQADRHGNSNTKLICAIHKARLELPIFLRVDSHEAADDMPVELRNAVAGVYVRGEFERLKELVDRFLFNRHYPNEFVASLKEFTLNAIRVAFKDLHIEVEPPYIVKDKIIYGELFSLMPLESDWCRGYMMLQSQEENVSDAIAADKTQFKASAPDFRLVNSLLGEMANMVRGGFKTHYGTTPKDMQGRVRVEVPIIVNHVRRFISFGTEDPQLCFKFTLTDPEGKLGPIIMYEKFIFSLDWSPEHYAESNANVNELVASGELELF